MLAWSEDGTTQQYAQIPTGYGDSQLTVGGVASFGEIALWKASQNNVPSTELSSIGKESASGFYYSGDADGSNTALWLYSPKDVAFTVESNGSSGESARLIIKQSDASGGHSEVFFAFSDSSTTWPHIRRAQGRLIDECIAHKEE